MIRAKQEYNSTILGYTASIRLFVQLYKRAVF